MSELDSFFKQTKSEGFGDLERELSEESVERFIADKILMQKNKPVFVSPAVEIADQQLLQKITHEEYKWRADGK